jgi:hypothetical protein
MGLLFMVAAALPLASNPTFCIVACHNMAPEVEAWKASSHAKVTCYACHLNRVSITHLLKMKLVEAPTSMAHTIFGTLEIPINAESEISQEDFKMTRCERCHTNENRKFTFSRGIFMSHIPHKKAGINCAVCHNRVAHGGAEEFEPMKSEWEEARGFEYENFLHMKEGCFRCHSANPNSRSEETLSLIENGKTPPKACTTCHTKDFDLPSGHDNPKWRTEHQEEAKKDFSVCMKCHGAGEKFDNAGEPWCTMCHDASKVKAFKNT